MDYTIKTKETVVSTTHSYAYFDIGNYVAFKVETNTARSATKIKQGIAKNVRSDTMLSGLIPTMQPFSVYAGDLEEICRQGFPQYPPNVDVYDYLLAGGDPKAIMMNIGYGMYVDLWDEPVPSAIRFDYMSGHVDNGHYDLVVAEEILKKRDDIEFSRSGITRIPSYNSEPLRDIQLEFLWMPTGEQIKIFMAAPCMSEMYKIVFDQDMLGLRKAALYETFYESREYD